MSIMYNKYHAVKTEVDGYIFDSKAEARRYEYLKIMEAAGQITDLELQPKYPLLVNGKKVATYIADFRYKMAGRIYVEDVKGMKTAVYNLKKKMMKAQYNIEIYETS